MRLEYCDLRYKLLTNDSKKITEKNEFFASIGGWRLAFENDQNARQLFIDIEIRNYKTKAKNQ